MTSQISQAILVTKQFYYFKEYIKRLKKVVGIKVEGALVSISAGTNDFPISYYDLPSRRDDLSMEDYQDYILKKLQNFINILENMFDASEHRCSSLQSEAHESAVAYSIFFERKPDYVPRYLHSDDGDDPKSTKTW
ncbi:unnamed protein product [Lactuca saligna]|uniref:GDSL esterase/lipase n=1 Tax=Lactuca saligna TaxID=75948 RepID=A0AA36EDE2_LACSI|nr:unnamed protein product [Lactuca saligna]